MNKTQPPPSRAYHWLRKPDIHTDHPIFYKRQLTEAGTSRAGLPRGADAPADSKPGGEWLLTMREGQERRHRAGGRVGCGGEPAGLKGPPRDLAPGDGALGRRKARD